jgi:hypothetical protein|tara:strand:+ start:978 stop:1214 length:237 start_codon:yes stop_codon:yes gene_type:complete
MVSLYTRLYRLPVEIRCGIELRYDGPVPEEAIIAGEAEAARPAAPDRVAQENRDRESRAQSMSRFVPPVSRPSKERPA